MITKRGRPVAKLVPCTATPTPRRALAGSVLKETGDPIHGPASRGMQTLLDTHAWVWWVTGDRRLTRGARRTIERARAAGALSLSMISVWEVAKKVEKGQLVLDRPVDD